MGAIFVDGSNVLFWRGGQPETQVPELVVRALCARRFAPIVHFDHSIYQHLNSDEMNALEQVATVVVAPRGTSADEVLLVACLEGRTQIVSCDRFRSWRKLHPRLCGDWLVTGRVGKGGRVSFSKKLRAAPL